MLAIDVKRFPLGDGASENSDAKTYSSHRAYASPQAGLLAKFHGAAAPFQHRRGRSPTGAAGGRVGERDARRWRQSVSDERFGYASPYLAVSAWTAYARQHGAHGNASAAATAGMCRASPRSGWVTLRMGGYGWGSRCRLGGCGGAEKVLRAQTCIKKVGNPDS